MPEGITRELHARRLSRCEPGDRSEATMDAGITAEGGPVTLLLLGSAVMTVWAIGWRLHLPRRTRLTEITVASTARADTESTPEAR
jgi:hypothetical protein